MIEDSIVLAAIRRNPGINSMDLLCSLNQPCGFDEIDTLEIIRQTERLKKQKYLYGDWINGLFTTGKIFVEC